MKFKGLSDWIEIFRGGKQVDSEGREHDGDALIDKAVANFRPGEHEPPAVIGHPKDDAPAYAWVEGLAVTMRDGVKTLMAKFKQVVPEFAAAVEQGLFKKRSAAFYQDGTLRHVGFLGAAPPAVKGLQNIGFKERGVTFEFASDLAAADDDKESQAARAKKYGIAIKEGGHVTKPGEWDAVPDEQFLDPVNYRYPCPDADQTRAAASYWGQDKNKEQYTPEERSRIEERLNNFKKKFGIGEQQQNKGGKDMSNKFKEKYKQFLTLIGIDASKVPDDALPDDIPDGLRGKTFSEAELEAAKTQAAKQAKEAVEATFEETRKMEAKSQRKAEISKWVEDGVKDGRIWPALKDAGLIAFLERQDAEESFQFSEGETGKKTDLKWMQDLLDGFSKLPFFAEFASKNKTGGQQTDDQKQFEAGKRIAAHVTPKK